ncbi:MAG: DNA polymerase III subunit gamma/tau, partial [Pseudomonadota bacterium]
MTETAKKDEYLVLARKYRPQNFSQLKGQDALVRTLTNAIESGRVAHAFMLTGVRGVGKTTTARIIARALNCIGPDGKGGPTVTPCGECEPCVAIAADRHVDVLEMDAASRTGVENMRDLIDSVQYAPSAARYKVYIIDEVHMLSTAAFNALLKTLEEPPEYVKFVFATTEIRKVPITVLSRCQRFDLRRVSLDVLISYFSELITREGLEAEEEAISQIARAADGSVRDGLSLLDQAMALSGEKILAQTVTDMLGLVDRSALFALYNAIMGGEREQSFEHLEKLYATGADPVQIVEDLLDLTHFLTKCKVIPNHAENMALPEIERKQGGELAAQLSMPVLTRAWQILSKGRTETQYAANPLHALEMVVVRLLYAADMPTPGDLVKKIQEEGVAAPAGAPSGSAGGTASATSTPAPAPTGAEESGGNGATVMKTANGSDQVMAETVPVETPPQITHPQSFEEVVTFCQQNGEPMLAAQLKNYAHLVK